MVPLTSDTSINNPPDPAPFYLGLTLNNNLVLNNLIIGYCLVLPPGRSLSALSSSQVILNPDTEECYALRGWYDSEGHQMDFSEYQSSGGAGGGGGSFKDIVSYNSDNLLCDPASLS